jgi:UDP:flavonoid glycosyltransferase YjiC (YdhE family)
MPHVAMLVFPDHGTVGPALTIGSALAGLGHRLSYVVDEQFAPSVTAAGARAVPYRSALPRPGSGADLALAAIRESIDVVRPLVLDAFAADVPDLLVYDFPSFFPARFAARHWDRPAVQLFTGFAANEHYAPLPDEPGDPQPFIDLVSGALDDPGEVWSMLSGFDERNLVLLPRGLQPRGETFDDRYAFTGHAVGPAEPDSWSPPGAGRPVWVVLGTNADDRPGLRAVCEEAFAAGDWHPVMAVAPGNEPDEHVLAWDRFRAVLPHVEAVVCHWALTSVVEALYFGKPVVFITYGPEDQVIGRRLTELGVGRVLAAEQLSPSSLRAAVSEAVADGSVRRRVRSLRAEMLAEGGPDRAAEAIDTWLSVLR